MSGDKAPLIPEQRQQELLRLLQGSGGVLSIRELTAGLNVSHMTVRRDIAALEQSGQVVSVQGGVRLADWAGGAPPRERSSRAALEMPRKQSVARTALSLVEDGSVLYLDAGTTCQEVVPLLAARTDLTVVTNDFHAALGLMALPSVHAIHTGGETDADSGSSSGPIAARTVGTLNIDLAFLSTGAWDLLHGVSSHSSDKVLLKQAVMRSAASVALLADSTKWGGVERFTVARLDELDTVVTDADLPTEVVESIEGQGPKVLRAE
ncbi:DeoR/GlpR family DNA-binding transcription regulator [Streptomyces sp. NPDC019224]|uniref:DeoR/GlpR family DNA-binding transcription regulator n=1 Tax=Streptomyces sp. NPDC019224 TaxID=3154484 RepID=UPI0033EE2405